ncbi:MAG: hypothetical protein JSW41_00445 [Candidatus Aenigmatarchaeota archaeon]|nr:MAG: hypothetical protein JSW41_00445 [Candidatus Aenigmarchaeota archaeon]
MRSFEESPRQIEALGESWSLNDFSYVIKSRIIQKYDCIILVTGPEGSGKSGFAQWMSHHIDSKFRIEKHCVFYDIDHFWRLWREDSPGQNIILDEAVAQLFNRKHSHTESIQLVEEMIEGRFKRKIIWMCIPRKEVIDPYLRKFRAKYWVWIPEIRGKVTIREALWREFENPKIKDGTWWEWRGFNEYPPVPKGFEAIYDEHKKKEKKAYDMKRMTFGSEIKVCKKCGTQIFFKKIGKNWIPYEATDGREHIPLCGKSPAV